MTAKNLLDLLCRFQLGHTRSMNCVESCHVDFSLNCEEPVQLVKLVAWDGLVANGSAGPENHAS